MDEKLKTRQSICGGFSFFANGARFGLSLDFKSSPPLFESLIVVTLFMSSRHPLLPPSRLVKGLIRLNSLYRPHFIWLLHCWKQSQEQEVVVLSTRNKKILTNGLQDIFRYFLIRVDNSLHYRYISLYAHTPLLSFSVTISRLACFSAQFKVAKTA